MTIKSIPMLLATCLTAMVITGCFSGDDDDRRNGMRQQQQQSSNLTQLTITQCNRNPENEEPLQVADLSFSGDPDSETEMPASSTFSDNCI